MSREIQQDFSVLLSFIKDYKLDHLVSNDSFILFISQQHKKYFSYLTAIAEFQNFVNDSSYDITLLKNQFSYIKESCSDVGVAFFSTFHGSYKSSKLLLRSSIETFLKGFCLDEINDLDKEKSIYELFRKVKALSFFLNDPSKGLLESIHQNYKLLCQDVHTATDLNMAKISALNYFPTYNSFEAQKVSDFCLSLIPNYLTLICLKYNQQYHKFHYKNKSIVINAINKKYRPIINNIK